MSTKKDTKMITENQVAETETQVQKPGNVGKTTGLKFIQGFGHFLTKYGNQAGNRDLVKMEMLEEYPAKLESVEKWLDWYKGYFNMGRIKGFNQDKSLNVKWVK
jgi:hypothetical protein